MRSLVAYLVGAATVLASFIVFTLVITNNPHLLTTVSAVVKDPFGITPEAYDPTATIMKWESISIYQDGSAIREVAEPVGKITVTWDSAKMVNCTGTVIDARLILTAAHCLKKPTRRTTSYDEITSIKLIMSYNLPGDRNNPKHGNKTRIFSLETTPLEIELSNLVDYALLKSADEEEDPAMIWGRADLSVAEIGPSSGGWPMIVVHHPKKITPKQVTRYGCYTNGQRYGPVPEMTEQDVHPMGHNCDTIGGSSGAPMFLTDNYSLVGIHRGAPSVSYAGQEEQDSETPASRRSLNVFSSILDIAEHSQRVSRLFAGLNVEGGPDFGNLTFDTAAYSENFRMLQEAPRFTGSILSRLGQMQIGRDDTVSYWCNGIYLGGADVLLPYHCVQSMESMGNPKYTFGLLELRELLYASVGVDPVAIPTWFEMSSDFVLSSQSEDFAVLRSVELGAYAERLLWATGPRLEIRSAPPEVGEQLFLSFHGPSEDLRSVECTSGQVSGGFLQYECDSDEAATRGSSGGLVLDSDGKAVAMHQKRTTKTNVREGLLLTVVQSAWQANVNEARN